MTDKAQITPAQAAAVIALVEKRQQIQTQAQAEITRLQQAETELANLLAAAHGLSILDEGYRFEQNADQSIYVVARVENTPGGEPSSEDEKS